MVGGGGSGNIFHVRLKLWQYVGGGVGCGVGRCTVDGAGSVRAAKGGITFLVFLVGAICCDMSGEEGFFSSYPSALYFLELVPSLTIGWEGEGSTKRAFGDGGQVPAFNGEVGTCSLILYSFLPKYVLGHAGSFVPPYWHGKADIDGVCVIKTITVVGQVVEDLSHSDIVVVGFGIL